MTVLLEITALEVANSIIEVPVLLEKVLRAELPAFAIHEAWLNVDEAIAATVGVFVSHDFAVDNPRWTSTFEHRQPSLRRERLMARPGIVGMVAKGGGFRHKVLYGGVTPLHADSAPTQNLVDTVLVNTTEQGSVQATFFEPSIAAVDKYLSREQKRTINPFKILDNLDEAYVMPLPRLIREQLASGEVDEKLIIPRCHQVLLQSRSTVFFRAGGRQPLYHEFKSLEIPRVSKVRSANLKH